MVVGEPTSLEIVNGHFGMVSLKISVKGKAVHSSKPEEGNNAIETLLKAINKIQQIRIQSESLMSLVMISGGIADNVIPERAEAVFSLRISPNDKQDYFQVFQDICRQQSCTVEELCSIPSVYTNVPQQMAFIPNVKTVRYCTELSYYKHGVVIGPGDIADAHTQGEKISRAELLKGVEVYKRIIQNYVGST